MARCVCIDCGKIWTGFVASWRCDDCQNKRLKNFREHKPENTPGIAKGGVNDEKSTNRETN